MAGILTEDDNQQLQGLLGSILAMNGSPNYQGGLLAPTSYGGVPPQMMPPQLMPTIPIGGAMVTPEASVGGSYSRSTSPTYVNGVNQPINENVLELFGRLGANAQLPSGDSFGGGVGANWYGGQVNLPNELKDLGAPEHVKFGSRGITPTDAEIYYQTGPNRFSADFQRRELQRDKDTPKIDNRFMLKFLRQL